MVGGISIPHPESPSGDIYHLDPHSRQQHISFLKVADTQTCRTIGGLNIPFQGHFNRGSSRPVIFPIQEKTFIVIGYPGINSSFL